MNEVAYFPTIDENPNFISRLPDPGPIELFKTIGQDALYHSPFSGTRRFSEMTLEKSDYFNPGGETLSAKDATHEYGLGGQLNFDEPIKRDAAELMMRRKIDENDRNYVIASGSTTGMRRAAGIGVGMAASLLDPINVGAMFIPVVGEARFARMVKGFGGSVLKARLAQGAIEGAVGTALIEPFIALPALQEQANYSLKDSAENLAFGAGLGAFLHAGFGAIGDRIKALKPRESDAIFAEAMNNILNDEPVKSPAVMEGLSESSIRREASDSIIRERGVSEDSLTSYTNKEPTTTIKSNLGDLIGTNVEYAGYKGKLIRDAEGSFVVLREVTLNGEPNYIEVAGTGKDPSMQASELGVFPEGTQTRAKELTQTKIQQLNEKLNENQIRKESQGQIVNQETKTEIPRINLDEMGKTSESPEVMNQITKEADDLQAQVDRRVPVDDEERIQFEAEQQALKDEIKQTVGNPKAREDGVNAAVKCITEHLL